jgi:hypothetical protein
MLEFKSRSTKYVCTALLAAGAVAAVAIPAFAATGQTHNCVIFDISADTNASRLTVHCTNDTNHYTAGYSGCPATNTAQIQMWHSQAMAAMLSGKKMSIWWDDACGSRAMSGFVIRP